MKKNIYSKEEQKIFQKLNTPSKVQDFLNGLQFNFETSGETCMSPRKVLLSGKAHCMEGAMLAAAAFEYHGAEPLVLDLRSTIWPHDDDHVVAVFKRFGCFGAVSKTNHAVLRYREPVYKTLRELVLSYFHEYFLESGKKTLREFSPPVNLSRFDKLNWQVSEKNLFEIPKYLNDVRHFSILSEKQIKELRKADAIEIKAGKLVEWKRKMVK